MLKDDQEARFKRVAMWKLEDAAQDAYIDQKVAAKRRMIMRGLWPYPLEEFELRDIGLPEYFADQDFVNGQFLVHKLSRKGGKTDYRKLRTEIANAHHRRIMNNILETEKNQKQQTPTGTGSRVPLAEGAGPEAQLPLARTASNESSQAKTISVNNTREVAGASEDDFQGVFEVSNDTED